MSTDSPTEHDVALVTGTSSGMGLHTAIGLARSGRRVVATMRNPARSAALTDAATEAGMEIDVRTLDVTDTPGAARCVDSIVADYGRIDLLVNNAGRGSVGTLEQLSRQDLQDQLDVNYLGVAELTRLVLPVMRAAGRGRIVTVTSVGGVVGQPFADAYCGAKFAVEGLMQSLAPVVAHFGVDVSIVEPAAVASAFIANVAGQATDPAAGADPNDPYAAILSAYLQRTAGAFAQAQPASDAASVIVEAATTATPKFRWQTSDSAVAFAGLSLADLDGSGVLAQTGRWLQLDPAEGQPAR